jgi:site-specific DNA-methyltransferase (adenine-specific)
VADLIPLHHIKISDDRQRRNFKPEAIAELAESIAANELLHAVVVDINNNLIAGERRIRALKFLFSMGSPVKYNGQLLPRDHIPCTRIAEKSEEKIYEAELVENLHRVNLTVQEEADAIAKLHHLRRKQNPRHTVSDTARELSSTIDVEEQAAHLIPGNDRRRVSEALLISEYSHDPRVAQAKSRKQAISAVDKIKREEHAKRIAVEFREKPEHKTLHDIRHCSAEDLLSSLPSTSVGLFLTDPPYGINAQEFGTQTSLNHQYNDTPEEWRELMLLSAEEMYRVGEEQCHAYIFCDYLRFPELRDIFTNAGWVVWRRPLFWYKGPSAGMLPYPDHGPRYSYETILFANKGHRPVELRGLPDILHHPRKKHTRHAAEKPPTLFHDLLRRSLSPGGIVCDPFMGCGPILPAANALPAKVIACDLSQTFYGMAIQRLEEILEEQEAPQEVDLTTLFSEE